MMQKQIPASSSLVHLFKGFHGGKCKFHVDDVTFFLEHMSPMVTMFSKVTGWDLLSLMARPAEASGALLTDNVLSGLGTDVSNLPRVGNHVKVDTSGNTDENQGNGNPTILGKGKNKGRGKGQPTGSRKKHGCREVQSTQL